MTNALWVKGALSGTMDSAIAPGGGDTVLPRRLVAVMLVYPVLIPQSKPLKKTKMPDG